MPEYFYFTDSHGDTPFVRAADHETAIKELRTEIKNAVEDAQIRVGCSANCYNEPKEAQSGADYVAKRVLALLEPKGER